MCSIVDAAHCQYSVAVGTKQVGVSRQTLHTWFGDKFDPKASIATATRTSTYSKGPTVELAGHRRGSPAIPSEASPPRAGDQLPQRGTIHGAWIGSRDCGQAKPG